MPNGCWGLKQPTKMFWQWHVRWRIELSDQGKHVSSDIRKSSEVTSCRSHYTEDVELFTHIYFYHACIIWELVLIDSMGHHSAPCRQARGHRSRATSHSDVLDQVCWIEPPKVGGIGSWVGCGCCWKSCKNTSEWSDVPILYIPSRFVNFVSTPGVSLLELFFLLGLWSVAWVLVCEGCICPWWWPVLMEVISRSCESWCFWFTFLSLEDR